MTCGKPLQQVNKIDYRTLLIYFLIFLHRAILSGQHMNMMNVDRFHIIEDIFIGYYESLGCQRVCKAGWPLVHINRKPPESCLRNAMEEVTLENCRTIEAPNVVVKKSALEVVSFC